MIFPLRDAVEPLTALASEAGLWQPEAGFLLSLSHPGMAGKALRATPNAPSRKPCQMGGEGADGAPRGQVICLGSPSRAAASWARPQASRCPI